MCPAVKTVATTVASNFIWVPSVAQKSYVSLMSLFSIFFSSLVYSVPTGYLQVGGIFLYLYLSIYLSTALVVESPGSIWSTHNARILDELNKL
jgi:hypothetical protein